MIAGSDKILWQAVKNRFLVVMDAAGLAVHDSGRAHDVSAERLTDGLVAETNTQERHLTRETPNYFHAHAGVFGESRTGRDDHVFDAFCGGLCGDSVADLIERNLIVTAHFKLGAELAEKLRQVVGKRIVIIDE